MKRSVVSLFRVTRTPNTAMRRASITLAVATILISCGDGLGPAAELSVLVDAHPTVSQEGIVIDLVGVAYNGSDQTITSRACGPGIRLVVTDSLGMETDLMPIGWTCITRDSNEIHPGETDVYPWEWMPPGPGTYAVRSYVRVDDGPTVYSRPTEVQIFADPDGT